MKKELLMAAACLTAVSAMAQTRTLSDANPTDGSVSEVTEEVVTYPYSNHRVVTNTFWHNWFISLNAGAQVYFGDHDRQASFGDRISPALDFSIGKWFTPGLGARITYSGLQFRGATKHPDNGYYDSAHGTGDPLKGGGAPHWLEKSKFNYGNAHIDFLFNLNNLIGGYKPNRVWTISPYVGVGWAWTYDKPHDNGLTANAGLLNAFRVSDAFDINLDIKGMLTDDCLDGEGGGRFNEGAVGVTLGVTYRFPHRSWDRPKDILRTRTIQASNEQINELRRQVQELGEVNNQLKQALASGNQRQAAEVVKKIAAANLVTFTINSSKLSNEARVNLGMLAKIIKEGDPEEVYNITGYADKGTGSAATNERLSRERTDAVYDCLVNEFGVPAKQLHKVPQGGVEPMFYHDPRLSRAVITAAARH